MKKIRNWLAYRLVTIAKKLKVHEDERPIIDDEDDVYQTNSFDFEGCSRLHLNIHYLNGGQIIEVTSRNPSKNSISRNNREHNGVYLVSEGTDLSERVKEIVFTETIKLS